MHMRMSSPRLVPSHRSSLASEVTDQQLNSLRSFSLADALGYSVNEDARTKGMTDRRELELGD